MDEAAGRLILVGAIVLGALLLAGSGHLHRRLRSRSVAASPLDLTGVEGRVLFFSDAACPSCDVARSRLEATGAPFREFGYHRDPAVHRRVGVIGVPLLVIRDHAGAEVGRIAGEPARWRLRRLLRRAGIE